MIIPELFRQTPRWAPGRHVLLWLALATAPAFSVTALVTASHREHQRTLAREWNARGQTALESRQPNVAVDAFRNALRFSPDDRDLRLRLGESLAASGRVAEARAYLLGLWQAQPGSGRVNLQLARLAVRQADRSEAILYYHNAIEGAWPEAAEQRRREARFELSEYLVGQGASEAAEVELLALAAGLPHERDARLRAATLLSRAGVHRRALGIYDDVLDVEPGDREALIGAARSALALGNHAAVVRYLRRVPSRQLEQEASDMLEVSTLVLDLDPYRRGLRAVDRAARARRALAAAAARLEGCAAAAPDLAPLSQELSDALKTQSRSALARDADRMDAAVSLAFRAERAAQSRCGPPAPVDRALLLLDPTAAEGTQ